MIPAASSDPLADTILLEPGVAQTRRRASRRTADDNQHRAATCWKGTHPPQNRADSGRSAGGCEPRRGALHECEYALALLLRSPHVRRCMTTEQRASLMASVDRLLVLEASRQDRESCGGRTARDFGDTHGGVLAEQRDDTCRHALPEGREP